MNRRTVFVIVCFATGVGIGGAWVALLLLTLAAGPVNVIELRHGPTPNTAPTGTAQPLSRPWRTVP